MAKEELFYFKMFHKDWLSSQEVLKMTSAQRGAYIHLLCLQFDSSDCSIYDDISFLINVTKASEKELSFVLKQFVKIDGGKLRNKRIYKEWLEIKENRERLSRNGSKGARKRWGDSQANGGANGQAIACYSNSHSKSYSKSNSQSKIKITCMPEKQSKKQTKKQIYQDLLTKWNAFAISNGLQKRNKRLTEKRIEGFSARCKEEEFLKSFDEILQRISESDFLLGKVKKWKVDLDFIIHRRDGWVNIVEEKYANRNDKSLTWEDVSG